MAKLCLICLNAEDCLLNVREIKSSNLNLLSKLKSCVPDIDWRDNFQICLGCSTLLENAYKFRELCLRLKDARYKVWNQIENSVNSNTKDESIASFVSTEIVLEREKENIFICFHCEKNFSNKTFLARHIKAEHTKFEDSYFNKKCTDEILSKKHDDISITEQKQNVEENHSTTDLKPVENEVIPGDETFKEATEDKNECDICGTSFNNKYLLKRHKKNVHATEKNFKCDICPSSFVSSVYLKAHQKYHTGERQHVCLFCGKRYITASDLYHHEKIHANKRAYGCPECNKAFNTSSDLHKHKICVHMDRNLWKYSCDYCNRRFPLKTNLDTHIKTHTGEKNFSCHLCDKKCISRSALTRHIDSHTNVQSFKCTICDSGYKYQKSLHIHMVKNHGIGDIKLPERVKKYFCHVCPRGYFANSKLQKHLRTHTGDKPFKCPNCEKCFIDKSYIKQHLKIAHNYSEN